MLTSILSEVSIGGILICSAVSVILGFLIALTHKITSKYNKNFLTTLTVLPLLVMSVIMIVSGNLGMSVAVAGTFGLVRFRSVPGTSKEILSVFFAMAVGLACGAGYIFLALALTILGCLILIILNKVSLFEKNKEEKLLRITLPENLDYTEIFNDVLNKYTSKYTLEQVKTTNLGSMFELKYIVILNKDINEKQFIDELRMRNGNLKISLSQDLSNINEL